MNNYQAYIDEVVTILSEQCARYTNRIEQGKYKITLQQIASILGIAVTSGGVVGSIVGAAIPIPVAGSAIGSAGGATVAASVISAITVHHMIHNRKLKHAINANQIFKTTDNAEVLLTIAQKLVENESELISKLSDNPKNYKRVAKYLVTKIIKQIEKHTKSIELNYAELHAPIHVMNYRCRLFHGLRSVEDREGHKHLLMKCI